MRHSPRAPATRPGASTAAIERKNCIASAMNLSPISAVLPSEMAENDTQDCPYCAVRAAATLCPHCRSRLEGARAPDAYRNRPGRQIGGVSIALAEAFGISVTLVRLAFIVLTFLSFIGPPLYLVAWVLLPGEPGEASPWGRLVSGEPGEPSILERAIQTTEDLFVRVAAWFRGETPPTESSAPDAPPTPAKPQNPQSSDTPMEGAP
jgi:phage shock protein PspC (stress-responsive transcriptional regulator)